jgi:hypothetical protein
MLRQVGEHDILVATVLDEYMASRFDSRTTRECTQRCYLGSMSKHLVAKGTALGARVTIHTLGRFVLDQRVVAFQHAQFFEDAKLHSSACLFTTNKAMAPTSQSGISSHLTFKVATHTCPVTRRHG